MKMNNIHKYTSIFMLPIFIIFVWHTEIFFNKQIFGTFSNGIFDIPPIILYHILMYLCIILATINIITLEQ